MSHRHFVVRKYDPVLEERFEDICKMLFNGDYLVVKEYRPKEHYHVQGVSQLTDRAFEKVQQEEISAKHRYRKEQPKSRLCVNSTKEVNERGFQYMVKQEDSMVVCTTLGDDVIARLVEASREHVKQLKNALNEYVHPLIAQQLIRTPAEEEPMRKLLKRTRIEIGEFCFREGKQIKTGQMKDRAVNCLIFHPKTTVAQRHWFYTI